MSRALEPAIKDELRYGDHQRFFKDISRVLTERRDELLDIEILGSSHSMEDDETFLEGDNAIGIPKIRLVQAFLIARAILKTHLIDNSKTNRIPLKLTQEAPRREVQRATAVILLFDPEHLSAANMRKRLLHGTLDHEGLEEELRSELWFVDNLLVSRLHRHTKSPTLWNHRKWLVEQASKNFTSIPAEDDLVNVVMTAAERHPRNYYAWCHARYLSPLIQATSEAAASRMLAVVQTWCISHHNDTSGWSFLSFLLSDDCEQASVVLEKILHCTEKYKWYNESVWCFLRDLYGMVSKDDPSREQFRRVGHALCDMAAEESWEKKVTQRATAWVVRYHQ
ncbi:hypothetical protein G7046_g6823 [Stylonectria norvegica]|nr:hypothetical protein G7046_g6823 [Stylonectria norvegica]